MLKLKTYRIGGFLTISLVWSLLWFSQKHILHDFFGKQPSLLILLFGLIPTIGLLIGSYSMRKRLTDIETSILGKNSKLSILIMSIPIICLLIIGVENSHKIQPNLFGLLIGMFTVTYAVFEEIGWRGYLQEEFKEKNIKWVGYLFIGIVWYLWHWYFLREGNNPRLIMIPILIGSSIGLGEVARITKSILICGSIHSLVNITIIYSLIANNISNREKLIIFTICLLIWIPLIVKINKSNKNTPTKRTI